MKKALLSLFFVVIGFCISYGQGTIRGKVTDENGAPLIGVTVVLKSNGSIGTVTDFDGNYSLTVPDASPQVLVVNYLSYQTIEESVIPVKGGVFIKNIGMKPASSQTTMQEVVVTAKAVKEKEYYVEKIKRNSATTIDYVSSETMKKTGDVSVVAAVTRVVGVSTNSGGLITVRGIGDRYVKTSVNGSRIPTLDPFTNNIKLDLFPASLVDNIFITKTASPDLPGDWAGAYISVETKDYPEQLSVNVETSVGYNNQSTFKDVVTSQRSSTDWLGYDNGFRDYDHSSFVPTNIEPTRYQQFVALGLGDYYNSIGVTGSTPWTETYFKLGLVKLGLLGQAQFNDQTAVTAAEDKYLHGTYQGQAFDNINAAAVKANKAFPNNWKTTTMTAPLDFSQNFSIGNQVKLFGRPLGFLTGFRYSRSMQYDPNAVSHHAVDQQVSNHLPIGNDTTIQGVSRESNGWSALLNLAYKLNPNNSITVLFMPNMLGVNKVRNGITGGISKTYATASSALVEDQFYESRKQMVYQFKSEHYVPSAKLKAELNASYTHGTSDAPDFKVANPLVDTSIQNNINIGGNRYFRYLKENIFDSRASLEMPIDNKPDLARKIKLGGGYQRVERNSDQYDYAINDNHPGVSQLIAGNENSDPYSLDKFDIRPVVINGEPQHTVQKYYIETGLPTDHSFGYSEIRSAFAMVDYAFVPFLRFSGGVRVEDTKIHTDAALFDSLAYASDDPRRYVEQQGLIRPGSLQETNYLPMANIIYKLRDNERSTVDVRLNFSQTIARPSLRELSNIRTYDYELKSDVSGNPNLKIVHINNYDLRLESYFKSGNDVSVSLFYKEFKNHIEITNNGTTGFSWQTNPNKAWLKGIEIEGKKVLTKNLELRANLTLVDSKSSYTDNTGKSITHTMLGQAPYVVNGILSYTADSLGLTVTASYNVQGKRLVFVEGLAPAIYEFPRNLLDMKISKKVGNHFGVSLKVTDILSAAVIRKYSYPYDGFILDYDQYNFGTTYVLGISYKL